MFYASSECPVCKGGTVGFRKCSDGKTVVLVCDECDAVWLLPDVISAESAVFLSSPEFRIESLGCSIATAAGSRWATLDDIKAAQLDRFVVGEGQALHD